MFRDQNLVALDNGEVKRTNLIVMSYPMNELEIPIGIIPHMLYQRVLQFIHTHLLRPEYGSALLRWYVDKTRVNGVLLVRLEYCFQQSTCCDSAFWLFAHIYADTDGDCRMGTLTNTR
jgi:hypothetical protein